MGVWRCPLDQADQIHPSVRSDYNICNLQEATFLNFKAVLQKSGPKTKYLLGGDADKYDDNDD